jgi:hypothetical protein
MKRLQSIILMIAAAVSLADCSSSKKLLQRGEYYPAVMEAIRVLRSSPDSKKQQQTLLEAYPLLKANSLRLIEQVSDMNAPNRYSTVADEYLMLNHVADAIHTCPKALQLIPQPAQYSRELGEILPKAAAEAYDLGEKQLRLNTMLSAREAYHHFVKTNEYVNGYRNVTDKIAQSLDMATLKVVVQKPVAPAKYQISSDFFYDNLMARFAQLSANSFVRFFTEEEARKERLTKPDHFLVLDFADFAVGNVRETKNTAELHRDSVLVGTTKVNGMDQNVYGRVKAEFTTFRREVISQGTLSAKIVNAAGNRVEQHRNFPGRFVWFNEWATYKGDERALSDKQKKMTKSEQLMPPPQQDLFVEFTKPMYDQTVAFVKNQYGLTK